MARDDKKGKAGAAPRKPKPGGDEVANGNVGNALRSVYNQTVGEDIPDEMLDLLGKLS